MEAMFWILRGTGAHKVGTDWVTHASHHPSHRPMCTLSPHVLVAVNLQQSLSMGTTQGFLPHMLSSAQITLNNCSLWYLHLNLFRSDPWASLSFPTATGTLVRFLSPKWRHGLRITFPHPCRPPKMVLVESAPKLSGTGILVWCGH